MENQRIINISKKLSYYLRHAPEKNGLKLDKNGWADVSTVLSKLHILKAELEECVAKDDKQRYAFDERHEKIRANQGHSIKNVDLELPISAPPKILYHGTVEKYMDEIMKDGLKPMSRQHVHLSTTIETAEKVGSRRGKPIILKVDTEKMTEDGMEFRVSSNGVWLTDGVPAKYLSKFA
uniref:2'-phosphotransferase n=1 Tax=Panagrolaimus sp. PS1159 TaxID=55785 RepID=A0AC35EVS0_9BILA